MLGAYLVIRWDIRLTSLQILIKDNVFFFSFQKKNESKKKKPQ